MLSGADGDKQLANNPDAVAFVKDADRHCKAAGWSGIPTLSGEAGLEPGPGLVDIGGKSGVKTFINAARIGRFWEREPA